MSETGNGRKNWTRVVAAVGLVFLAVAGGIVLANANKVINKTEKKDEETPLISIGFSQVGAESDWRTANTECCHHFFLHFVILPLHLFRVF